MDNPGKSQAYSALGIEECSGVVRSAMCQSGAYPLQDLQRIFASLPGLPESGDSTHKELANAFRFRRQRVGRLRGFPADTVVVQSGAGHFFATVEVAAIQNDRIIQQLAQTRQVEGREFLPLGQYQQSIGAFGRTIRVPCIRDGFTQVLYSTLTFPRIV